MAAKTVTTRHRPRRALRRWYAQQRCWVFAILCVLLAACSMGRSDRAPVEYLDEGTGATIMRLRAPMVFYAEQPARAANVRDYIYAAPVAVNEAGQHSYWLWLAAWSTTDHGVAGDDAITGIGTVTLLLDGEPLELDGSASRNTVPGTGHMPYPAPVPSARTLVLPLSASQIQRLAAARDIVLYTSVGAARGRSWLRWSAADGLQEFAAGLAQSARSSHPSKAVAATSCPGAPQCQSQASW